MGQILRLRKAPMVAESVRNTTIERFQIFITPADGGEMHTTHVSLFMRYACTLRQAVRNGESYRRQFVSIAVTNTL